MIAQRIRPLVICLFRHHGRILVAEGYNDHSKQFFYRPLGGGIEYGEHSLDALRREIREEINAEIRDPRYLCTIENIFSYQGALGHEIVQVYDAAFVDPSYYEKELIIGHEQEADWSGTFKAVWKTSDEFRRGDSLLVPEALLEYLD